MNDVSATRPFRADELKRDNIRHVLRLVKEALEERGYNSVNQLAGYLISNDIGYIPDFDDNRNKMAILDRTLILEKMISEYLRWDVED